MAQPLIRKEQVEPIVTADITDLTASAAELNTLDGITATTAELNILDGVTATASELNALDGITATVTELNYTDGVTSAIQTQLDGKAATSHTHTLANVTDVTASAAEVNILDGATLTVTELNYVDGVTSAIQTQLDGKQPLDSDLTTIAAANNGAVLAATTASFLTADETKLDGIEALADVTDATNVTAAGALMDSELADIVFIKALSDADASTLNTGTSTSAVATADALAGSYAGTKSVVIQVIEDATDLTTGDGKAHLFVPSSVAGMNLVGVHAYVETAGTTGTTDIQIHNETQAADMLTTKITIDSTEATSRTAATAPVIDGSNDDVAAGDKLRIDIDAVSTTAPKGLWVEMEFRLP